jgi:hypothetical protein
MFHGLSTDQAPPISVPFRFFVTAPIFGILIGLVFLNYPQELIFDRYSNVSVATIHLFTLGVLAMSMFGALQQMLPVLAGAVIKRSILFANIIHTNLTLGTLGLSGGFLYHNDLFLQIGSISLTLAFGLFFITIIKLLFRVKFLTSTVKTMKLFSLVGLITFGLGLFLLASHITSNILPFHIYLINIHILFGMFGFAGLLIIGVAFQVIPMFYVAKAFPKLLQEKLPISIVSLLMISFVLLILQINTDILARILLVLLSIFAYYGLNSLNNRRRYVFDVTLWYWKLSLYSAIIGSLLYLFNFSTPLVTVVFIFGFLYSLLQGMIYKIVPFLSWFHLNAKGYFNIPTLRGFILEYDIKIQFFVYTLFLTLLVLATFFDSLFLYLAGAVFIVSNILYITNILRSIKKYRKIDL